MVTLQEIIPALPLLESGRLIYLAGRFADLPKPGFETQLNHETVGRLTIFHWLQSLGLENDVQERIFKAHAKKNEWKFFFDWIHNQTRVATGNAIRPALHIADSKCSIVTPRETSRAWYNFMEDQWEPADDYETVHSCHLRVSFKRLEHRWKYACKTPAES